MATVYTAKVTSEWQVTESLDSAPGTTSKITSTALNPGAVSLNSTSTPPATKYSASEQTIGGGGTVDVDLTALPGLQGAFTAAGLKLQRIRLRNTATHAVNIAPGGANGYVPFGAGNDIDVPAGSLLEMSFIDTLADVDGTHKILTLTGTAADVVKLEMLFG